MSLPAIVTMVLMLAVYFGGFLYFALRQPPASRTDRTNTP
jgi:hypothetical protein